MADIPNTRLINHVDTPATIHYSQHGQAQVPLDPAVGSIIDVSQYRRVSVEIGQTHATSAALYMGKISGATLSMLFAVPLDGKIHTFEIVGPQITLWLSGAAPNSQEQEQLWVYLTS